MSKTHDILNDCLERIRRGEVLEDCLLDYPEQAGELRQMIETAWEVERFSGTVEPRAGYIQHSQAALGMAYQQLFSAPATRSGSVRRTAYRVALTSVMTVAALVIVFTGGLALSVRASEQAMPGETLYPLKLATESIRLAFAVSDERKVSYLVQFAEARVEEMTYAAAKGEVVQADSALDLLENHLARVSGVVVQKETSGSVVGNSQFPELEKIEDIVQNSYTKVKTQLGSLVAPGVVENTPALSPTSGLEIPVTSDDPGRQEPGVNFGTPDPEVTQEPDSGNKTEPPGLQNKPETPASENKAEAPGQVKKAETGSSDNASRVDEAYSQVIETIDSAKGNKFGKSGK